MRGGGGGGSLSGGGPGRGGRGPGGGSAGDGDELLGRVYDRRLVGRLLAYVRPHRRLVLLAMLFMSIATAVDLVTPWILKDGIDRYLARLYLVWEGEPQTADALLPAPPQAGSEALLPAGPGVLLVRTAGRGAVTAETRRRLEESGTLQTGTCYLFPADAYRPGTGSVRGDYWLVPEDQLSRVPPATLVRIRGADIDGIRRLALYLGGLILLGLLVGYGHVYTLSVAGQRAMYDLRVGLFRHLGTLALRFYDQNPQGRLVTRVTNDIEALNEMFAAVLVNLAKDILLLTGTVALLFAMNARLALVALAVLPVIVVLSLVFRRHVRGVYRDARRLLAALNAGLAEDLGGVKVVQAFGREQARRSLYRDTNDGYLGANLRQLVIFGIFRPAVELMAAVGVALVLVQGGVGVLAGTVTLGALVAFIAYVRGMFQPVADMSEKYNIMQSAMAAAERIFGIMDTEPEVKDATGGEAGGAAGRATPGRDGRGEVRIDPPAARLRGHVEFRHVSFAYTPETPVLRDISFTVEPGRSAALVGPTGAGKTSILSLLCRFYDVQEGAVLIDGIDVRHWPAPDLRRSVAIVLQDAFIFSRSIRENITLGTPMPDPEVWQAVEMVQASDFIARLPEGLDTVMAERGATLSTGQRQLICLARALAHHPSILILDEATSSVDPETERRIQQATVTLMRGRTSIVVAHRLSTIQSADEILVFDGGRILERGTHRQLLDRRGIYHNLHLLQYRSG